MHTYTDAQSHSVRITPCSTGQVFLLSKYDLYNSFRFILYKMLLVNLSVRCNGSKRYQTFSEMALYLPFRLWFISWHAFLKKHHPSSGELLSFSLVFSWAVLSQLF
jgi:hypothetical protein